MERKAGGQEQFEAAKTLLRKAKAVEELKAAQTVVLPLKLNLTLEQTAVAIGRSPLASQDTTSPGGNNAYGAQGNDILTGNGGDNWLVDAGGGTPLTPGRRTGACLMRRFGKAPPD